MPNNMKRKLMFALTSFSLVTVPLRISRYLKIFWLILKIKEKKFQALRVKTLTFPTPRLESSYDV